MADPEGCTPEPGSHELHKPGCHYPFVLVDQETGPGYGPLNGVFSFAARAMTDLTGADYNVERQKDGPFSFWFSRVKVNPGSTLTRESILFNDPACPVGIQSNRTKIVYRNGELRFAARISVRTNRAVAAIQTKLRLFDVFGQRMQDLVTTESRDFHPGHFTILGEWRLCEGNAEQILTTAACVTRVRLDDGRQWVFNKDNFELALNVLDLEREMEDDKT